MVLLDARELPPPFSCCQNHAIQHGSHSSDAPWALLYQFFSTVLIASFVECSFFVPRPSFSVLRHRLFHTFEWMYRSSHYLHHSAHPVNTYIGNGGDFIELAIQGEMQVFFPPMFVPINIRLFMINAIFMQAYTLFLHTGERIRM